MKQYQKEFLKFALSQNVLKFGEFKLKSGRISPYFFNSGLFNTGAALNALGDYYAQAAVESNIDFDLIFGPAYKGIPLVSVVSAALARNHNLDLPYAFDRKEVKDHGEGGLIVGHPLKGKKILIVDDVISAGTSVRSAIEMIEQQGGRAVGVLIALDRHEKGKGAKSTISEIEEDMGIKVASIVNLQNLIEHLQDENDLPALEKIQKYNQEYGSC